MGLMCQILELCLSALCSERLEASRRSHSNVLGHKTQVSQPTAANISECLFLSKGKGLRYTTLTRYGGAYLYP